jgi:hypothetical protein
MNLFTFSNVSQKRRFVNASADFRIGLPPFLFAAARHGYNAKGKHALPFVLSVIPF